MGIYGWDASHHDWSRGAMNLVRAKSEGISFFTHKASDGNGWYRDPQFTAAMARAFAAGIPVVGAYHVLWPGNIQAQADWFVRVVDDATGGRWRNAPFLWQLDAELFKYFSPYRKPNVAECNAFCDRVHAITGMVPIGYLPNWLYGSSVSGFKYPLWSSAYVGGTGSAKSLYTGDNGTGWRPYGGKTPVVWQYSANATVAGQRPADVNVFKGSVADLQAILRPIGKPTVPTHPSDPSTPPTGGTGMSFNTSLGKDADQSIAWAHTSQITWDKEWGDPRHAHSEGNNPGYNPPVDGTLVSRAIVSIKGLKFGDRVTMTFQEWDWTANPKKQVWSESMRDVYEVPSGVTPDQTLPVDGHMMKGVVKGHHYYVALTVYPADGDTSRPKPTVVSGRWFNIQT